MRTQTWILATLLLFGTLVVRAQPTADPIGEALFPPELVMQNQQAIGLSDQQKDSLKSELRQAQQQFTDLQWKLQDEVEQMAKLLSPNAVDEKQVLAQLEKVLNAEREVKRRQITLLVRIKNLLTAEQQGKLRALRANGGKS
jgi:Spy/CpxP family protein refolding chaperone